MGQPVILMLEHDADDRFIAQTFFDEHDIDVRLDFVNNHGQMMDYLDSNKNGLPALILMNMNAVPLSAAEILKELKSNDKFRHIPVVVLFGSSSESRIRDCYAAGASSVIQKPDTIEGTKSKILSFAKYWFETVEL
jgi:CheY-like chemotaxis protein